jgi:hypothetical protein
MQVFQSLSPKERLMMGLGDVTGPADGSDLAAHPAMRQRLASGMQPPSLEVPARTALVPVLVTRTLRPSL